MCLPYLHHVFMKTRKLLLLLALAAATTGMQAQRIKGSDTVLPIAQQTAERFMTLNPSASLTKKIPILYLMRLKRLQRIISL